MNNTIRYIRIISILIFMGGIFSAFYVPGEFAALAKIHTPIRITDIILRIVEAILAISAAVGMWKMKKYGYYFAIADSALYILARLFYFVLLLKPTSMPARLGDATGIITRILIILYLIKIQKKFK